MINCIAESNWESGFHFEPGARLDASGREIGPRTRCEGLVLKGCIAKNNGWRNTDPARFFMSGFYVHRNANLTDCSSVHNRNAGFYVQGGEKLRFDGCSDRNSTYGWMIVKSSHGIVLEGCRSDQAAHLGALGRVHEPAHGHGLHADRCGRRPRGPVPARVVQGRPPVRPSGHGLLVRDRGLRPGGHGRDHARGLRQPLRDHGPPCVGGARRPGRARPGRSSRD